MALPELTQEILNLRPGHHLCLFYEKDPSEQMPALVPFIQDALSSDEQFVYIADDQTVEELEVLLKQSGINVAKECDRGALNFGLAGNGASREAEEHFKIIDEAIQRGAALVRQLLTIARKTVTHRAPADINAQISELAKLIKETFPKTITVSLELGPSFPPVIADVSQIGQVLLNLCVNARDAMPSGGSLIIRTNIVDGKTARERHREAEAATYVSVEVSDTGKGIDENIRNRIFEPFFTTKKQGEGTGLGLAIVYGIIKSHKGFIDIESESGRGTTFRVYLPVDSAFLEFRSVTSSRPAEPVAG